MKKKKLFLVIISMILFCGCTAKVDLVVTTNHKVIQKIEVSNEFQYLKESHKTLEQAKASFESSYRSTLDELGYSSRFMTKNEMLVAQIKNGKSNLHSLSTSLVFTQLFDDASEVENTYIWKTNENGASLFEDTLGVGVEEGLLFDTIDIAIQFHNEVVDANSDSYDQKTNTYHWFITKKNLDRNIEFTVTEQKRYDIIMAYLVKKYLPVFVITIVSCVILGLLAILVYQTRKANEL